MTFDDDEEIKNIVDTEDLLEGEESETIREGIMQATLINNPKAPLDQTNFRVLIDLTGSGSVKDRAGLDLVMVLDVSGSMGKEKLDKVKMSMEFIINKLSTKDRLSVVKFSTDATRVCRLRQITKESQEEIKRDVNKLESDGNTNIAAGLETALAVLAGRRIKSGRTVAIMLMSDGEENIRKAAEEVDIRDVPVFTFGFGESQDAKVLAAIADKNRKGTFSDVQKEKDLSSAFAKCLGGLLTVVVEELELTLKSIKSAKIVKVCAGNYTQVPDTTGVPDPNGYNSVTVSFGNLYIKEVRKVIVKLLLPAVPKPLSADVLEIAYKYKIPKEPDMFDAAPLPVRVRREGTEKMPERPEVILEKARIKTTRMMKEARILADEKKLNEARKKLAEAQNRLADIFTDEAHPMIDMLNYELSELMDAMQSDDVYEKQGRPFALSSETSHERQRYAARGDLNYLNLFSTPRMDKYLEQVQAFEEDPTKPVPTEEEDVKQELAADPLAPIAGALSYYIQNAIQSLQAIDNILKKPLNA